MRSTSATEQVKDDEIERQHQEEIHAYHQRQEETEQELARLRAELEDQAVARQALSAELEERNRASEDRQRDQEEHSELVAALHADIAQEKDRATDLGVRLQEALLDVDGIKNAEQILIGHLQQLRDERTKHFQSASESQATIDDLHSQVAGLKAQLDATTRQLSDAQEERDTALKSQSAEAQRMMRDRIAEVDGDRAILEHQNANLHKELEDLKVGIEDKLNSTRNTATRQVDGYKAELSLSKAQLRDAQRREAILSDELAMLKDNANAISSDRSHQSEVAKDAVATVTRYYEACRPLLRLVNAAASSKRTGSDEPGKEDSVEKPRAASPISAAPSSSELRDSVLIRGLASAQAFDLEGFSEAINKVVTRLKRYTKGYKHMRDVARNKISFSDFQKGDVVS
jgi:chromosome segregation ATPase